VKRDANFKQSRDVREDRGQRQIKTARPSGSHQGKVGPAEGGESPDACVFLLQRGNIRGVVRVFSSHR